MKVKICEKHRLRVLILSFVLCFSSLVSSSDVPIIDSNSRFHPVFGSLGMVVSQEQVASEIGAAILTKGGNAIDAAVATGFALAVTLPRAGNLGGGGFMVIHLADSKDTITIDYREMAPIAATTEMFLDDSGEVDNKKARYSIYSSGVPGTVAGLLYAHEKFGSLSLAEVITPAIDLAKNGIEVSIDLSSSLATRRARLMKDDGSRAYFYKKNGDSYLPGEVLKQNDLAETLKRIKSYGRPGFYQGLTADLIVKEMVESGGLITHSDLKNYRVVERNPVCGSYHDKRVCAMPPPSSGGVHLIQMLNMLENFELQQLGHNSAAYIHALVEVMRRAYADRSAYLGDPDYYDVPVERIIDKEYAKELVSKISLTKSSDSSNVLPGLGIDIESLSKKRQYRESEETTHFSVWDSFGNVVSNTTTLNFSYGSGISVSGGGFLLNNEMDDFSSKPGAPNGFGLLGGTANEIEPGKRPLSSMTPTIVFDQKGSPILTTGSPGGSTIITIVLQIILNVLEFDMGIAEASSVPRIHHQWFPDRLYLESGVSEDTKMLLRNMGHKISSRTRIMGSTQSIQKGPNNFLFGKSDPRRQGAGEAIQD